MRAKAQSSDTTQLTVQSLVTFLPTSVKQCAVKIFTIISHLEQVIWLPHLAEK